MINGVPQNDMENGWVYWFNWDGVGDVHLLSKCREDYQQLS